MNTYERYLELAEEFSEIDPIARPFLKSDVIRKFYEQTGKTPLEYEGDDGVRMLLSREDVPYQNSIRNYIYYLTKFNDFLYSKGIDATDYTLHANFTPKYIAAHTEAYAEYHTPYEISAIVQKYSPDIMLDMAIIKSFYEGITYDYIELFSLRSSMVDRNNCTIQTPRGIFNLSAELLRSYIAVSDYTEISGEYKNLPVSGPNDSLIPSTSNSERAFKSYCERRVTKINKRSGYKLTAKSLYYNGFVNYVVERIGVKKCIELFDDNGSRRPELNVFAEEYNLGVIKGRIRVYLRPFVNGLKKRKDLY